MMTTHYTVNGMTCAHCAHAVSTNVSKIPGVSDVTVDLSTGDVTVTSDEALDRAAVKAAVEDAGYELTHA